MRVPIDLRSDTVTKPTPAMRRAMAAAEVGDDVYGEDSTVNRLQALAAELTGKEDALFVASGTQGNLVALLTHCGRGDGAIVGRDAHIYYYEAGGLSVLGGVLPLVVDDAGGLPPPQTVHDACREPNVHFAPARLLCLENTHNRAGGVAIPPDLFRRSVEAARQEALAVHLDGARLFNAATKWGVPSTAYADCADSVQLCLSKGLGAPVGSLVCASRSFIAEARHWRKRLGGGMRQVGVIAAAGLVALEQRRERLVEDQANAAELARMLAAGGMVVEDAPWRTNMVFCQLPETAPDGKEFAVRCAARGVLFGTMGARRIRLVTHADVTAAATRAAARVILAELQGVQRTPASL